MSDDRRRHGLQRDGDVYGLGLVKLLPPKSPWIDTARQLMPALIAVSAAVVCVVMATEIFSYVRFANEIPWFAMIGVSVTLGITCVACMMAALVPGRDPLGLSAEQLASSISTQPR